MRTAKTSGQRLMLATTVSTNLATARMENKEKVGLAAAASTNLATTTQPNENKQNPIVAMQKTSAAADYSPIKKKGKEN